MRYMTTNDVVNFTTLSRASVVRLIASGKFPAPIRISERRNVWRSDTIEAWMEARSAMPRIKDGLMTVNEARASMIKDRFAGLSVRARYVLRDRRIGSKSELARHSDADLLRVPNCGRVTLRELRDWQEASDEEK